MPQIAPKVPVSMFHRALAPWLLMAGMVQAQNAPDDFFRVIRANDLSKLGTLSKDRKAVNTADARGVTPLLYASAFGSIESMRLLLDAGAEVNAKSSQDVMPLHWGAWDPARVRLLVDRGADVKARTKQGRTALIIAAAIDGASDAVDLLLSKGADASAADESKTTALHGASVRSDIRVMRALLVAGAKVDAADALGYTPLMSAAGDGKAAAVNLLLGSGARVNAASTFSGKVRHGEIALKGLTPLMLAAPFGSPSVIGALLKAGADVKARDVRGMTPLMLAVSSETQNVRVCQMLIEAGSDLNAKSNAGETVLDWARKSATPDILRILERAGAKPGNPVTEPGPPAGAKDVRQALNRSVPLLQRASAEFFKQSGCVGCHHQPSTALAIEKAKTAGIAIDEGLAAEQAKAMPFLMAIFQQPMLQRIELPGSIDQAESTVLGMLAHRLPADLVSDTVVSHVAMFQRDHGGFVVSFGISRAPVEELDIARTAYAVRILSGYGWPARKAEFDARIKRARTWLLEADARTSYERAEQLLGLKWSGATQEQLKSFARSLLRFQRGDGGWAQNQHLGTDAYATAFALYALNESGAIQTTDPAYQRGVAFLLRTQRDDGSWYVRSRAPKFQPYFESGFPHGHDQWISATATAYAVAALAPAVPSTRAGAR